MEKILIMTMGVLCIFFTFSSEAESAFAESINYTTGQYFKEYALKYVKKGDTQKERYDLTPQEITLLKEDVEQKDDLNAVYRLYFYYTESHKNPEEADKLLCRIAGNSSGIDQYNIGSYIVGIHSPGKLELYSVGWQSKYLLATSQIKKLAEMEQAGNGDAAYRMYEYYNFSKEDYGKALHYLASAYELGNAKVAPYDLAYKYLEVGSQSREKKSEYFSKGKKLALLAKKQGNKDAEQLLEYLEYDAFSQEFVQNLITSAEANDKYAAYTLYKYYQYPVNENVKDDERVEKYLSLAAQNGHTKAQIKMAEQLYRHEQYDKAEEWVLKAKNSGDKDRQDSEAIDHLLQQIAKEKSIKLTK